MTATSTRPPSKHVADPDEYRMTIGEHLEELRTRVVFGLIGFFIAAVVCLIFGKQMIAIFCRPLTISLVRAHINPQVFYTEAQEPFMVYIKISLICALAFASPWIVYHLWQ